MPEPVEFEQSAPEPIAEVPQTPPSLRPVERSATPAPARRPRSSWLGWGAAVVLLGVGGAFYAFTYVPMQRELQSAQQAAASQPAKTAEPQAERLQPSAAPALVAAPETAQPSAAPARVPAEAAESARDVTPSVVSRARRADADAPKPKPADGRKARTAEHTAKPTPTPEAEDSESKAAGKVDRAAAAAATAALEAQTYGAASAPAEAPKTDEARLRVQPTDPKTSDEPATPAPRVETQDGLGGVVQDSSDPLDGL